MASPLRRANSHHLRGGVAQSSRSAPRHGRPRLRQLALAMPAWGGTRALFGTNPIAAVFRVATGALSIDMSLSDGAPRQAHGRADEGKRSRSLGARQGGNPTGPKAGLKGSMLRPAA